MKLPVNQEVNSGIDDGCEMRDVCECLDELCRPGEFLLQIYPNWSDPTWSIHLLLDRPQPPASRNHLGVIHGKKTEPPRWEIHRYPQLSWDCGGRGRWPQCWGTRVSCFTGPYIGHLNRIRNRLISFFSFLLDPNLCAWNSWVTPLYMRVSSPSRAEGPRLCERWGRKCWGRAWERRRWCRSKF